MNLYFCPAAEKTKACRGKSRALVMGLRVPELEIWGISADECGSHSIQINSNPYYAKETNRP